MKIQAAAMQGGLAALGLIAAYTTWQREPERKAGESVVVAASMNNLQKVRYEDDSVTPPKWIELESRKEADGPRTWLRVSPRVDKKTTIPERELRGNEGASKVFEKFAPLKATRALGVLTADKLKELNLDAPKKRIEITAHGQKRVLLVGSSPFGMSDPFVRDEADNKVYVLATGIYADLDNAAIRLVDRQLHDWKTSDFDGLRITAGDKKRELIQTSPEVPAQAKLQNKAGQSDELAKNWHEKVFRLLVSDVLGKGEVPAGGEPKVAIRIDYTIKGKPKGWVELARVVPKAPEQDASSSGPPPPAAPTEYYARSDSSAGWMKLGGAPEPLLVEGAKIAASADLIDPDLLALVGKYERMSALRARLGKGMPSAADRELLRSLSRDFPGALRELETMETAELARRLDAARAAADGGEAPDWLRWTAAYHAHMRRALALRAGQGDPIDELAESVRAPRHGRLNVIVFEALAKKFATPSAVIWDTLFPRRGTARRDYR